MTDENNTDARSYPENVSDNSTAVPRIDAAEAGIKCLHKQTHRLKEQMKQREDMANTQAVNLHILAEQVGIVQKATEENGAFVAKGRDRGAARDNRLDYLWDAIKQEQDERIKTTDRLGERLEAIEHKRTISDGRINDCTRRLDDYEE